MNPTDTQSILDAAVETADRLEHADTGVDTDALIAQINTDFADLETSVDALIDSIDEA